MAGSEYRFRSKVRVSPSDVQDGDAFAIKIVAIAGTGGDWAAYVGMSHLTDDEVARSGDKIDAKAAKELFYVLAMSGRGYRQ